MASSDQFCSLKGTHQPGLYCLSDEQLLPILMHLDVDTLLHCGRTSSRLFQLVCDPEIWKRVFKQTEDFTKERLKKLVIFCTRDCVCPEIRFEAVKVAARGIVYPH